MLFSTVFRFLLLFAISKDCGIFVQKILIGSFSLITGFIGFGPGLRVSRTCNYDGDNGVSIEEEILESF